MVGLVGAALVVVGVLLPWMEVGDETVSGWAASEDAKALLGLAGVAAVAAALVVGGARSLVLRVLLGVLGLVALAVAVFEMVSVARIDELDPVPGVGLLVGVAGGATLSWPAPSPAIGGSVKSPRQRGHRLDGGVDVGVVVPAVDRRADRASAAEATTPACSSRSTASSASLGPGTTVATMPDAAPSGRGDSTTAPAPSSPSTRRPTSRSTQVHTASGPASWSRSRAAPRPARPAWSGVPDSWRLAASGYVSGPGSGS